jgi:hypothetical protein
MQLDGPDLEALLVRAHHEYGSDLRIVNAEKIRSGGVGGFFSHEHYELTVEVAAPAETIAPAPAPAPATAVAIDEPAAPPRSLLELADAISDREVFGPRLTLHQAPAAAASNGPAISTDGASFASVLATLTETVQQPAPAKPEETVAVGPTEPFVAARPPLAAATARLVEHRPAPRTSTEISLSALREIGLPSGLLPTNRDGDLLSALVGALRALPPLPQPPARPGDILAIVGDSESAWDAAVELALSIGLDERAVMLVTDGRAPAKVAPARRVGSLDELAVRVDRWRKRSTSTIVVIDSPMAPAGADRTRQALHALEADAVWLVVPATRKTRDVAEWIQRLRGADALVVTDVAASSDPASVLQFGIPVAWLEGRSATAANWAGLIVARLVDAA